MVFNTQFGVETLAAPGPFTSVISNATVHLLLWGSTWDTPGAGLVQPWRFFSGQTQYGTDGKTVYAGSANYTGSSPSNGFTPGQLQSAIQGSANFSSEDLGLGQPPGGQALFVAVTPPVINSSVANAIGYNTSFSALPLPFLAAWIGGGGPGSTFSIDTYTQVLSHEVSEAITNPGAGATGVQVSPGPTFPNPPANSNQICDYEAQNYTARLNIGGVVNGVDVQSYWSLANNAFVIPDGSNLNLTVNNGTLLLSGNQPRFRPVDNSAST